MNSLNILRDELFKLSAGRLLDIGTGAGKFIPTLKHIFKDYQEIVGIDSDEDSLEQAQKQFSSQNIQFLKMNAERLAFDDDSFDSVCISNSLHHLMRPEAALNEMKRVLKPGGLFLINEMFSDQQTEEQVTHMLYHHLEADIDAELGTPHKHTYKKQEILDMVHGLEINIKKQFEYIEPKTDFKNQSELDRVASACDSHIERAKNLKNFNVFKKRGEEIKQRLYQVGILRATQLVVVGLKPVI
ncbi:class I SAM-dependent methyltransferase [Alkalicoccobacillus porphyridii]|uniref:class I SAM-dependent methyltransferase n=1 Tax=Alkalicoccobacillus porphyridii TaxID=2597270 RepID=UPI00163D7199|nr:class I SAM-dependent methyltransferase [Alkalicoccobacillus porphyridii]